MLASRMVTRTRQLFGRPGTQVIPDAWAGASVTVAVGTMTCPVSIRRPGSTQVWDDDTEQMTHTPLAPFWEGEARVQARSGQDVVTAGGDVVHLTGYLVTLPAGVSEVDPGDLITVSGGYTDDPSLAGGVLRVDDVVRGSLRVERDVFCTLTDDT